MRTGKLWPSPAAIFLRSTNFSIALIAALIGYGVFQYFRKWL